MCGCGWGWGWGWVVSGGGVGVGVGWVWVGWGTAAGSSQGGRQGESKPGLHQEGHQRATRRRRLAGERQRCVSLLSQPAHLVLLLRPITLHFQPARFLRRRHRHVLLPHQHHLWAHPGTRRRAAGWVHHVVVVLLLLLPPLLSPLLPPLLLPLLPPLLLLLAPHCRHPASSSDPLCLLYSTIELAGGPPCCPTPSPTRRRDPGQSCRPPTVQAARR